MFDIDLQEIENKIGNSPVLESNEAHRILNHPIHVIDKSGKLSPSALVPFCKFKNWIGVKIKHFDVPVCDIFEATILNDQLCYEVDPNKFRNKVSAKVTI